MSVCSNCGFDESWATQTLSHVDLRKRLSELDAIISSLTLQRRALQTVSDAIIYPVLSLPPEIISEIFLRCLPSASYAESSPEDAPLLLTQICRQWRQVALQTPGLWTSLRFVDGQKSVELVSLWFSRSGDLPLDLNLNCSDELRAGALVQASMSVACRWRDVEFSLPLTSVAQLDLRAYSLPNLRTFTLDDLSSGLGRIDISATVTLPPAPSLRSVHLLTLPNVKADVPWAQLTTLNLYRIALRGGLSILANCTNLVDLKITTSGEPSPPSTIDLLTLNSLTSLTCDFETSILEHLTLPHLLHLRVSTTLGPPTVTIFKNFFLRSCSLRSFALSPIFDTRQDTLLECLRAVPDSVTELELTCPSNEGEIVTGVFSVLNPDLALPRLKAIHLRASGHISDEEYQSIADVVHARRNCSPVTLELFTCKFHTSWSRPWDKPRLSRLAQLKELAAPTLTRGPMSLTFTTVTRLRTKTDHVSLNGTSNPIVQSN
ncbi:F-box domain-containing protein [Favolaschia claudopus]|uniref:F-box domain-containing protein n=1 Tax=Favolaschia claudopus TaxID=2862362 RepID=A0AAW0DM12_9AGAR